MKNGMRDVRGRRKAERAFYVRHCQPSGAGRVYGLADLKWDGLQLRLNTGRLLATVELDSKWPEMCRVRVPDGHLTDMVNLTRAKDAAISFALTALNEGPRKPRRAWLVSQIAEAAE